MYLGYLDDIAYLEQYRDDGDENVALLEPLLVYRLAKAYASSHRKPQRHNVSRFVASPATGAAR